MTSIALEATAASKSTTARIAALTSTTANAATGPADEPAREQAKPASSQLARSGDTPEYTQGDTPMITVLDLTDEQQTLLRAHFVSKMALGKAAAAINREPSQANRERYIDARLALEAADIAVQAELEAEISRLGTAFGPFSSAVIADAEAMAKRRAAE